MPTLFAAQIAAFGLVPRALIGPMALLLPFFEVLLGGYLLLGLYTRIAAVLAGVQLLIFATAIGRPSLAGCRYRAAASDPLIRRRPRGPKSCVTSFSPPLLPSSPGKLLGCSPSTDELET